VTTQQALNRRKEITMERTTMQNRTFYFAQNKVAKRRTALFRRLPVGCGLESASKGQIYAAK
jgi:hypothetical protein